MNKRSRLDETTFSDAETDDDPPATAAATEGEPKEEVELLKKKPRQTARKFTEEVLVGPEGIRRVYEEFPKLCKFGGRGHEASDLKRLMNLYKEWAFQLFPTYAFEDVLNSTIKLGSKPAVRNYLHSLRNEECQRYMRETLGIVEEPVTSPEDTSSSPAPSHFAAATSGNTGEDDDVDIACLMALDEYTQQSQAAPVSSEVKGSILLSDESEGEWETEILRDSSGYQNDEELDMLEAINSTMTNTTSQPAEPSIASTGIESTDAIATPQDDVQQEAVEAM